MGTKKAAVKEAGVAEAVSKTVDPVLKRVGTIVRSKMPKPLSPAGHFGAKWGGRAILAGGATAYAVNKVTSSPAPMSGSDKMAFVQDQKEKVRKDIRSYERNKHLRYAATGAGAGSLIASAHLAAKGKKGLSRAALGGAFLSGVVHGRSSREEQAALNRIKRYYDLRDRGLFGRSEKTAVVGGAMEAITGILGAAAHTFDPAIHGGFAEWIRAGLGQIPHMPEAAAAVAGTTAPFAVDMAALPTVGRAVEKWTREHAHVAAKQKLGLPLSPAEELMRSKSLGAVAKVRQADLMPEGWRKWLAQKVNEYRGPRAAGGQIGEQAGNVLKEVQKFSPTLATAAVDAMKDNAGVRRLQSELLHRKDVYTRAGRILDSTIDEIPGLRAGLRASGRSGQHLAKDLLEHPETAIQMASKIKGKVQAGVRGTKAGLLAGGLIGAGAMLGAYRRRHPLSSNELPTNLSSELKRRAGVKPPNLLSLPPVPGESEFGGSEDREQMPQQMGMSGISGLD